jgi:RNA polymerase sigma-70 factor (ECF subfamily)
MPEHPLRTLLAEDRRLTAVGFQQLYALVQPKVFAFVQYRTTTREQAIDLTQDILLELYQALTLFVYRSDAEFYGFLFTITRRALARHYAHKHTKAALQQSDIEIDETVSASDVSELELSVRQALEQLAEDERDIIVLHHWSRYTFAEIGVMVNMTEGAVRTRHHRARAKLAHLLAVAL